MPKNINTLKNMIPESLVSFTCKMFSTWLISLRLMFSMRLREIFSIGAQYKNIIPSFNKNLKVWLALNALYFSSAIELW